MGSNSRAERRRAERDSESRTLGITQGPPRHCFSNAGRIIRRLGRRHPTLRYCEGFVFVDAYAREWTHHAWIQDIRTKQVYEVTDGDGRDLLPSERYADFAYQPIIRLTWDDYSEACWPAGYEGILLPCKCIGCEDIELANHGGGVDDAEVHRLGFELKQQRAAAGQ